MLDTTALSQAIETLAAETEANAISPAYLAAVLRKISDLISTAYTAATSAADDAQTTADDAREDIRTLQGTAQNISDSLNTETKQRTSADETLTNSIAAAKKELLKRLQGTSDSSVGYTDPFIQGGSFKAEDEMFAAIAANPLSGKEDSNYAKYTGNVRYDINGIIYDVHNYPINYATGQWLQAISGGLALLSDGTLVRDNDKYGVFYRFHDAEGNWTVWKKIEATDAKAVHHVTLSYDASTRRLYAFQYDANGNQLANFTDASGNTYHVELLLATSSRPGLISMADKAKLDAYPDYNTLLANIKSMISA